MSGNAILKELVTASKAGGRRVYALYAVQTSM